MPPEDGYTLLRRTREMWPERHMRALAVTALASEEDRMRAANAGFDQHLAKPIDVNHFLEIVSRLTGCTARAEAAASREQTGQRGWSAVLVADAASK